MYLKTTPQSFPPGLGGAPSRPSIREALQLRLDARYEQPARAACDRSLLRFSRISIWHLRHGSCGYVPAVFTYLIAGPSIRKPSTCPSMTMAATYRYLGITVTALFLLLQILDDIGVEGHGRLMNPPARNSMWRFGFPNPVNYNDNELYCGGYSVQWGQNNGQCGVCGDAYHLKQPRPHEAGGQYARGMIVRHYTVGQTIDVEVELTANHLGRFELHLCPNNNPNTEATQDCFDRYPLYVAGTRDVRFEIPNDTEKKAVFRYKVSLPPYVTCSQCVIQWNYYTGNMWGTCPNGTEAVGCGMPETFRNCADVSISTSTAAVPPQFVQQENPFSIYYNDIRSSYSAYPLVVKAQVCRVTHLYREIPGIGEWCQMNCLRYPPNCPSSVCECPDVCEAIGDISGRYGAEVYCMDKCLVYPSQCPSHRCRCY
ncbi:hypothetical protein KM043_015276 [Ampulex compressa]|nr:hypothetical protein KM043_015276 [Ampulex compressa]